MLLHLAAVQHTLSTFAEAAMLLLASSMRSLQVLPSRRPSSLSASSTESSDKSSAALSAPPNMLYTLREKRLVV